MKFFSTLSEKTLLSFAEQIEIKIAHPEEIIFKVGEGKKITVLREGKVGFCTRLPGSQFDRTVIDVMKVKKGQAPKLLSLNFLTHSVDVRFEIKSLKYSMISEMDLEDALKIMKESVYDF